MIMLLLLILLVLSALWAVLTVPLILAAIALALSSALLTMIMFQLGAPLAGVFELSVCAGLISVVFVSVISLTHRLPRKEYLARRRNRIKRFRYLPPLLIAVAMIFYFVCRPVNLPLPPGDIVKDVRIVMWDLRRFDLFGQILVLLAGVYGVLMLFRGKQ